MPDLTVLTYPAVRGPALTKKAGLRGEYPEDIHAAICGKDILTCQIKVYILVIKGDKSENTPEFYYHFYIYNRKGRACKLFVSAIILMNIVLKFDHSTDTVFVPDGYISDVEELRLCFFDWIYDNPEYVTYDKKGHAACSYNSSAFLEYINQVILLSSKEKAYFIPPAQRIRGKIYVLEF